MNTRRKALTTVMMVLLCAGLILLSVPFIDSLSPPSHAPAYATEIDISSSMPGSFSLLHFKKGRKVEYSNGGWGFRSGDALLLVRDLDSKFYLYYLPTYNGKIVMPLKWWGQYEGYCKRMSVNFGSLPTAIFCEETQESMDWNSENWVWSVDGKNLSGELPDLIRVPYLEGNKMLHAMYSS